ncbi:hypothetical protein MMC24_001061 [Lignoscripta atroalba]|nr:hypothetical protein [Lignoscripta atroalba]
MEDPVDERPPVGKLIDTALVPIHAAVSKPAQKAYLGTFLFAATSIALFCVSTIAYTLFYYNYVPHIGVERTIHLQFGDGNPYGIASLSSTLTSLQSYDVSLLLHLPRTPANLAAGNFMIDLSFLSPNVPTTSPADLMPSTFTNSNSSASVLTSSRRPAILTYASPIIDTASTLSGLPWYVMGWKKESEVLEVSMFEGVKFSKGWRNVPDRVIVVVEADEKMQFYDVVVKIVARFGGLRYILYNYRVLSYLFFTTTFFTVSLTTTLLAYLILSSYIPTPSATTKSEPNHPIKTEPSASDTEPFNPLSTSDLSDTSRTFPTLGRQMPLHFSSRHDGLKTEEEDRAHIKEEEEIERTTGIQPLVGEADDEDEEEDERDGVSFRDSGIGTSLEEGDRRAGQRRRKALFSGRTGRG